MSITNDDFVRILFGPEAMAHDWVVEKNGGAVVDHALWSQDVHLARGYVRPPDHRRLGLAGQVRNKMR